ncbi:hypothetical protein EMEDMD4_1280027 [Sinorhizobium medicae]|uniref:Xylulose 5-phosphate/Fructose 6-phosphate phosphoketolase N-terminal domain-containing protein n=1 Tax=Sinorhizobium medicae TaxID=110321 RepID=A0A508WQS8_9HYPH|nr:hypothetical protein EMEDMD4_1280027 [Sinorhizobium medicae]
MQGPSVLTINSGSSSIRFALFTTAQSLIRRLHGKIDRVGQHEGSWRSHQVPLANLANDSSHLAVLETWLRSYRPEDLFDEKGRLTAELRALAPDRRMGANPHANGGLLLRDLKLPDFRDYAVDVPAPGKVVSRATRVAGVFLRDVMKLNMAERNFRVFGPDETESNRLSALFEVTSRAITGELVEGDTQIAPDGRVMEVLSEHLCQSGLYRPRSEQESRHHSRLSAARCQHATFGHRPLPAQPQLHQCRRCGKGAGTTVVGHRCRGIALRYRHRCMEMGQQ